MLGSTLMVFMGKGIPSPLQAEPRTTSLLVDRKKKAGAAQPHSLKGKKRARRADKGPLRLGRQLGAEHPGEAEVPVGAGGRCAGPGERQDVHLLVGATHLLGVLLAVMPIWRHLKLLSTALGPCLARDTAEQSWSGIFKSIASLSPG